MLHILSSSLHHEELEVPFALSDQWKQSHQAIAVLTGGTEGLFLEMVENGKISLAQPIYIIASQQSNSLAASMEILTWINQHGGKGEIITEKPDEDESLSDMKSVVIDRIGMIGASSDWLISSTFDRNVLLSKLGIEIVEIDIAEITKLGKVDGGMNGATGGTEGLFLEMVENGKISLAQPIYIIASQQSNSLAASMEILTWINQHGGKGEIITEKPDEDESLSDMKSVVIDRIGMIGASSDWLISSTFDRNVLLSKLGIEIVEIDIAEITKLGKVDGGMNGAETIYRRIKEIIAEYQLTAITLRCFDLLTTVCNTGCIALSKLNDEGIPASCEGDIPTLITMILSTRIAGCPGFQANPARIDVGTGEMLFAHCTLPLSMTTQHSFTTHFESGIGVAIHGELPIGDYTLVKISGDLKRVFAEDVKLTRNQYDGVVR
jgi:hypothetical protein